MTVINELIPFSARQFDVCMAYLASVHNRKLSQWEMAKLHVMIDVYHLIEHGKPVIGGPLEKWKYGAVVTPSCNRIRKWGHDFTKYGAQPANYLLTTSMTRRGKVIPNYQPLTVFEKDDFSASEIVAMESAWNCVILRTHGYSDFFHDQRTFMGLVWTRTADNRPIAWSDIIAAYDELMGADHSHTRQLISA